MGGFILRRKNEGCLDKGTQSIAFAPLNPVSFGTADYSPGAVASSGLQVTYTSSNTSVAIIISGKIHIVGEGSTNITASQSGNSLFNPAVPVTRSLTVGEANQIITFNPIPAKDILSSDFNPGASSSSGLSISYTSSNTSVATIIAGLVHIVGVGSTNITASQAGNGSFYAAIPVIQPLTVNKANNVITFPVLSTQSVGNPDYAPGASANSGLAVSYASSDPTVATIVGGNIHIVGVGNCNITATQAGDSIYAAAIPVIQVLTVINSSSSTVDTSFRNYVFGPFIDINYDILRPNSRIPVNGDCKVNIIGSADTNTGQVELDYLTGSEVVTFNGLNLFTSPGIPGAYIVNFTNTGGNLTFS